MLQLSLARAAFGRSTRGSAALVPTWRLDPHLQAFFEVQPVNQLVIDLPAFPLQQDVQPAVAIPHTTGSQVTKSNPQFSPIVANTHVPMRGTWEAQRSARASLAHAVSGLEPLHHDSSTTGLYTFPEMTSCSIFLSRLRSATSDLSFLFSSSSCLQASQLGDAQPGELLLPAVERLLGDPQLANDLGDLGASFMLTQGKRDLLLRKMLPRHGSWPSFKMQDTEKSRIPHGPRNGEKVTVPTPAFFVC